MMLRVFAFLALAVFLTGAALTIKHKLFVTVYNGGGGILAELGVCVAIGMAGAAFIIGGLTKTADTAQHAVAVAASGTYTPQEDFDPNTTEAQYIMLEPGLPWSGSWEWAGNNTGGEAEEDMRYVTELAYLRGIPYQVTENADGSYNVLYRDPYDEDPNTEGLSLTFSADGMSASRTGAAGYQEYYVRPERSAADALPKETWGHWVNENGDMMEDGIVRICVDAFSVTYWTYSSQDKTLWRDRFEYDSLKSSTENGMPVYVIKHENTGNVCSLCYNVTDGVESLSLSIAQGPYTTFERMTDETIRELAEAEKAYVLDMSDPLNPTWGAREQRFEAEQAFNDAVDRIASKYYLVGISANEDASLYVDGESVDAYITSDTELLFDGAKIKNSPSIVRFVQPREDGTYYCAAGFLYPPELEVETGSLYITYESQYEDGRGEPAKQEIEDTLRFYYGSYLDAINARDVGKMIFTTEENRARMKDRAYSEANQSSLWDSSRSSIQLDFYRVLDETTIACNMKVWAYAENKATGEEETITNYQSILLVWENGAWHVGNSAFITQEEFDRKQFGDILL